MPPRIRHFDESGAKWRNLTPHWYSEHPGRRSLDSEPHENRRPSVTMPARTSARDDDSGRQHTVISKEAKNDKNCRPRPRHFDRSGAEWRNLMLHWYSEHPGRRSLGSAPQQSRSPSVTIPAPASARDDPWADRFPEKSHKKGCEKWIRISSQPFSFHRKKLP